MSRTFRLFFLRLIRRTRVLRRKRRSLLSGLQMTRSLGVVARPRALKSSSTRGTNDPSGLLDHPSPSNLQVTLGDERRQMPPSSLASRKRNSRPSLTSTRPRMKFASSRWTVRSCAFRALDLRHPIRSCARRSIGKTTSDATVVMAGRSGGPERKSLWRDRSWSVLSGNRDLGRIRITRHLRGH